MNRLQRAQSWARGERRNGFGLDELIGIGSNIHIRIENPRGSCRYGESWMQVMHNDYGYVINTIGADGDEVDCFLGPNMASNRMYVIDQICPGTGLFDEHKVMFGFNSIDEARQAYLNNYQHGWAGLRHVRELFVSDFWPWYNSILKY